MLEKTKTEVGVVAVFYILGGALFNFVIFSKTIFKFVFDLDFDAEARICLRHTVLSRGAFAPQMCPQTRMSGQFDRSSIRRRVFDPGDQAVYQLENTATNLSETPRTTRTTSYRFQKPLHNPELRQTEHYQSPPPPEHPPTTIRSPSKNDWFSSFGRIEQLRILQATSAAWLWSVLEFSDLKNHPSRKKIRNGWIQVVLHFDGSAYE